eukprot:TRINITY_DN20469_c0_g1_i2.p1 TRINITY_DN20469_c0_g1~~TRINITY_DN20469_c0_g1_i2.p1  ORF type:complete len:1602 (+),score=212.46 TRINITY_DN20469_c0_g1_i2:51-4856(+)
MTSVAVFSAMLASIHLAVCDAAAAEAEVDNHPALTTGAYSEPATGQKMNHSLRRSGVDRRDEINLLDQADHLEVGVKDDMEACWEMMGTDETMEKCNCSTCMRRGANWRFFTPPRVSPMSDGISMIVPSRYCLQVDSSGYPIRPKDMWDSDWTHFTTASTVMINLTAQCPEHVCPKLSSCGECTSGGVPCVWRGPAPAQLDHMKGACMFVGDDDTFNKLTSWEKPHLAKTRRCSSRGLIPLNRSRYLCSSFSSTASGDVRRHCAKDVAAEKHAVCLIGDDRYDCRSECDLYMGACVGVAIPAEVSYEDNTCFACLLFEECYESQKGEHSYDTVYMSPEVYGDWILSPGMCPGGCKAHRIPGQEVVPTGSDAATYYTPWFPDWKACLSDSRCQYCTYQFPTGLGFWSPHLAQDPGCVETGSVPYKPPRLDPDQKAYCKWSRHLGETPESACAKHTTYAACAGSMSIGCQWCLTTTSTGQFRQQANASNPSFTNHLEPRCLYHTDALRGCLSMRALRRTSHFIPLRRLFEGGKMMNCREQGCGAHQLYPIMLTMVSDDPGQPDPWYSDFTFRVSSYMDRDFTPMYVAPTNRAEQLERLKACVGEPDGLPLKLGKANLACRKAFKETCSNCLRSPGCWWVDNALITYVTGKPDFDVDRIMPGCYPPQAQQTYTRTLHSLADATETDDFYKPLRVLTAPEDSNFCYDPCWDFKDCSDCLGQGVTCQWCDGSTQISTRSFCTSVAGPFQMCFDKYTRRDACPVNLPSTHPQVGAASAPEPPPESSGHCSECLGVVAGLLGLPMAVILICLGLSCRATARLSDTLRVSDCDRSDSVPLNTLSMTTSTVQHLHTELGFHDLGFRVKVGAEEKQVLRGVSGSVSSGEFLAVMGPSGSGKTTFLDVLARRKLNLKDCDGEVLVNGTRVDGAKVRSYSGGLTEFVPQQDTMLAVHTVAEMLRFVADLKLGATMSSAKKDERVSEAIEMVSLRHRANSYVGSNLVRGISGGERRRAMIAAALVPRPPVLFLDEPTSGLSSTDSLKVVEMLGSLAKKHRFAVIAVVHQPQSRLFSHFDKLLLLSQGEVCYMGSAQQSVGWFEKVAVTKMPLAMNPADWLLDLVTPGFMDGDTITKCNQQMTRERQLTDASSGESTDVSRGSILGAQSDPPPTAVCESQEVELSSIPEFATGWLKQFRVVVCRCFQAKFRRWKVLLVRVAVNLGVAVIAGSALTFQYPLYVHANTQEPSRLINAALFFVVTFEGLIALTVLPLFTEERELFAHERKAKLYRVAPYFMANLSAEFVVQLYSSLTFGGVFYLIVGISSDLHRFLFYLVGTVLVGDCASAFAQLCSSASRQIVNSLALCAMGLGTFLLFSGFLVLPSSIPSLFLPLYHTSFWKYGFQALSINIYVGAQLPCQALNYTLASQCPPFGFSKDCPNFPCYNTSSGHAAAVYEYRRFKGVAEVHDAFWTSGYVGMFQGAADARQINCKFLCGPEEAPGRYVGHECVCSSFVGCRNDTKKDRYEDTRDLNGQPGTGNGSCTREIENVKGEYFLDALGFGRLNADGKPDPKNDPDVSEAHEMHVRQYAWLGALIVITTVFRVLNFVLIFVKRD